MKSVQVISPAKINLFLEVVCKRKDDYHDVRTYMVPISLSDTVMVRRTGTGSIALRTESADVPPGADNLVCKAAERFFREARISRGGADITLVKRIPVAAGLGGGSSNAAATLIGLNKAYGAPLGDAALREVAAGLGCDVPFFLGKGGAVCVGRGDEVVPFPCRKTFWVVLATPRPEAREKAAGAKTAGVYAGLKLGLTEDIRSINMLLYALTDCDLDKIGQALFNRLERVAFAKDKTLETVKDALLSFGASGALLSGSGPTVYGLTARRDLAAAVYRRAVERFGSTFRVFLAKTT